MSLTEEVKRLYSEGNSRVTISKILNQKEGVVRWIIEKNNLVKGIRKNSRHEKIIKMYAEGKSQNEISKIMGIKNNTVSWVLTKNNIKWVTLQRIYQLYQGDNGNLI